MVNRRRSSGIHSRFPEIQGTDVFLAGVGVRNVVTAYCVDIDPHEPWMYEWLSKPFGRSVCAHHAIWVNHTEIRCQQVVCQAKDLPYPDYPAYLSRVWRADERTRTADLFITSALLTREGADAPLILIVSRWRTRQRDRFPLNSR